MTLFSKLFKKKKKRTYIKLIDDYSSLVTDMHSHFIPGVDDGVETLEESLASIEFLMNLGIRKIYTTPHVMYDFYRNSTESIKKAEALIQSEIEKRGWDIKFSAAAEYYLDEEFLRRIEEGDILTLGEQHVLFELSYINEPEGLEKTIFRLLSDDYIPILAHAERYPYWQSTPEKIQELKNLGCEIQVNIGSFTGYYNKGAMRTAGYLAENNLIDYLGTDCHGERHYKILTQALRTKHLYEVLTSGRLKNSLL